jgi:hypothetical protein
MQRMRKSVLLLGFASFGLLNFSSSKILEAIGYGYWDPLPASTSTRCYDCRFLRGSETQDEEDKTDYGVMYIEARTLMSTRRVLRAMRSEEATHISLDYVKRAGRMSLPSTCSVADDLTECDDGCAVGVLELLFALLVVQQHQPAWFVSDGEQKYDLPRGRCGRYVQMWPVSHAASTWACVDEALFTPARNMEADMLGAAS